MEISSISIDHKESIELSETSGQAIKNICEYFSIKIIPCNFQIVLFNLVQTHGSNTDGITLAYITITCALTPCLYFLGMQEHRQKIKRMITK